MQLTQKFLETFKSVQSFLVVYSIINTKYKKTKLQLREYFGWMQDYNSNEYVRLHVNMYLNILPAYTWICKCLTLQ